MGSPGFVLSLCATKAGAGDAGSCRRLLRHEWYQLHVVPHLSDFLDPPRLPPPHPQSMSRAQRIREPCPLAAGELLGSQCCRRPHVLVDDGRYQTQIFFETPPFIVAEGPLHAHRPVAHSDARARLRSRSTEDAASLVANARPQATLYRTHFVFATKTYTADKTVDRRQHTRRTQWCRVFQKHHTALIQDGVALKVALNAPGSLVLQRRLRFLTTALGSSPRPSDPKWLASTTTAGRRRSQNARLRSVELAGARPHLARCVPCAQ